MGLRQSCTVGATYVFPVPVGLKVAAANCVSPVRQLTKALSPGLAV